MLSVPRLLHDRGPGGNHDGSTFDTFKLAKGFEVGGFTAEQAGAAVTALAEAATGADLATKADLATGLRDLEQRLAIRLVDLEHRPTLRVGGRLAVGFGIVPAMLARMPPRE